MRFCPACRKVLGTFIEDGLELDGCPGCGGVWFDGGELARVVSVAKVNEILRAAHGVEGECRECSTKIEGTQVCTKCGHPAPRCPACDRGPLAIAQLETVRLDVCKRCSGVWFDAGELQTLTGAAVTSEAIQEAAKKVLAQPGPEANRVACAGCSTLLRPSSALTSGGRPYCVKCAPKGATMSVRSAPSAGAKSTGLFGKLGSMFH